MSFDEQQFPTSISRGASSFTKRSTDIVTLRSGYEERNTIWANSKKSYDVSLGLRQIEDIYALAEFWEGRRGPLRGFRFKDWSDYKSGALTSAVTETDQAMSMITSTTYQMQKEYSPASNPWIRTITKPVSGTVLVADGTGSLADPADYSVDLTTGIVTFVVPPTGTPTCGFEFDVPVRFVDEELEINLELFNVGSVPSIMLIEVR